MAAYNVKSHPAFSGYDHPETTNPFGEIRGAFRNLAAWADERRAYRQAVTELNALSDRELTDIGIARSDIRAIARETAKANRNGY